MEGQGCNAWTAPGALPYQRSIQACHCCQPFVPSCQCVPCVSCRSNWVVQASLLCLSSLQDWLLVMATILYGSLALSHRSTHWCACSAFEFALCRVKVDKTGCVPFWQQTAHHAHHCCCFPKYCHCQHRVLFWLHLGSDSSRAFDTGASWVTQALLLCLGSIQRSMPIIAATFLGVIAAWLTSVRLLNRQLQVCFTLFFHSPCAVVISLPCHHCCACFHCLDHL